MDKDKTIEIILKDGSKVEGLLEMTFEANGDEYVIYSIDNTAYGARIREDDTLVAIEEDEWPLIEKLFNEYMEKKNDNI